MKRRNTKNPHDTACRSHDEWLALAHRYFEASTTEAEEVELRNFLVSPAGRAQEFDDVRAVAGFFAAARCHARQHKASVPHIASRRFLRAAAVAAVLLACGSLVLWHGVDTRRNQCVAYIAGVKHTDSETVMESMRQSMLQVTDYGATDAVGSQLSDIFRTAAEETTKIE